MIFLFLIYWILDSFEWPTLNDARVYKKFIQLPLSSYGYNMQRYFLRGPYNRSYNVGTLQIVNFLYYIKSYNIQAKIFEGIYFTYNWNSY